MMTSEEFNKQQDEILARLPKELRGYFSYTAWEQGHYSGYEEVLNILRGEVGDFLPALKNYLKTVEKELVQALTKRLVDE